MEALLEQNSSSNLFWQNLALPKLLSVASSINFSFWKSLSRSYSWTNFWPGAMRYEYLQAVAGKSTRASNFNFEEKKWIYFRVPKRNQWLLFVQASKTVVKHGWFEQKMCVWWDFEGVLHFELAPDAHCCESFYDQHRQRVNDALKASICQLKTTRKILQQTLQMWSSTHLRNLRGWKCCLNFPKCIIF